MSVSRLSPESSDNVNISISSHDLKCPITGEPFENPCMTSCGHLFERSAIQGWRNKGHTTCPSCRKECQILDGLPPIVKELLEKSKHPTPVYNNASAQQYYVPEPPPRREPVFTLSAFKEALLTSNQNYHFYISQLEMSETLLNDCSYNSQEMSPLYLLTSLPQGLSTLRANNLLCERISPEGLNRIVQTGLNKGTSPIYNLAQKMFNMNDSIAIMNFHNQSMRDKINYQGLNTVIQEGPLKGTSTVYWFIYHEAGLQILQQDARLRHLIASESLNVIFPVSGVSPVYYLTHTRLGIQLLASDENLRSKISSAALNAIVTSGYDEGANPLLLLASSPSGIDILAKDMYLRNKITAEGLNAVATNGYYAGTSALFWLAQSEQGRQLLLTDAVLRSKINSNALNTTPAENDLGKSPAYYFLNTASGKQILYSDYQLKQKIKTPMQEQLSDVRETAAARYENRRSPSVSIVPPAPPLPKKEKPKPHVSYNEDNIHIIETRVPIKESKNTLLETRSRNDSYSYTPPPPPQAPLMNNSMFAGTNSDSQKSHHHVRARIKEGFKSIFKR